MKYAWSLFAVGLLAVVLGVNSCGSKSSSDDSSGSSDSTAYTNLKTTMASTCAGSSCHSSTGWYSSEASFKSNLTEIQKRVAATGSTIMPPSGSTQLTTEQKAKFASYPN